MFCCCFLFKKNILAISIRPIIQTSTAQIFTTFAGSVELWPQMNVLNLYFRSLKGRYGWWRGSVVERRSLAGELSLSCARPAADG